MPVCVVSAVLDYGQRVWPATQPWVYPADDGAKYPITINPVVPERPLPTQREWDEFLELVDKARKWDELANQPHCEDPNKVAWLEATNALVRAAEALREATEAIAGDG